MNINNQDREVLKELRGTTRDKRIFVKCSVIIMLDEKYTYDLISISLGVSLKTIQRYKAQYLEDGVDGLVEFNYVGREKKLCEGQIKILEEEL